MVDARACQLSRDIHKIEMDVKMQKNHFSFNFFLEFLFAYLTLVFESSSSINVSFYVKRPYPTKLNAFFFFFKKTKLLMWTIEKNK